MNWMSKIPLSQEINLDRKEQTLIQHSLDKMVQSGQKGTKPEPLNSANELEKDPSEPGNQCELKRANIESDETMLFWQTLESGAEMDVEWEISSDGSSFPSSDPFSVIELIHDVNPVIEMAEEIAEDFPELFSKGEELLKLLVKSDDEKRLKEIANEILEDDYVFSCFVEAANIYNTFFTFVGCPLAHSWDKQPCGMIDRIRDDPLFNMYAASKEPAHIMRGVLSIVMGYWIDKAYYTKLSKASNNSVMNINHRLKNRESALRQREQRQRARMQKQGRDFVDVALPPLVQWVKD